MEASAKSVESPIGARGEASLALVSGSSSSLDGTGACNLEADMLLTETQAELATIRTDLYAQRRAAYDAK
jgi:hypothetical protein